MALKIIYMGTPEFAVMPLEEIIKAGYEVSAVVTQPDKKKGRGKELKPSPVKECALRHGIPVLQPVKIKEEEAINKLRSYPADIFIVAAFGQILSEEILQMPRYGCINIHASLLPKLRGAAPIHRAIIEGESVSGVTIMQMEKGLDTGDMLLKREVPIEEKETADSLHDKLAELGARMIIECLPLIEQGSIIPEKQDDEQSSYAKMLNKQMGYIDWSLKAIEIERLIRGLNSWPSAYTYYQGKQLKIWDATVIEENCKVKHEVQNGEIVTVSKEYFDVATGEGSLRITAIQPEGKKRMAAAEFLRGYSIQQGAVLGRA